MANLPDPDQEWRQVVINAFVNKLHSFATKTEMIIFFKTLTRAKLKTFIIQAVNDANTNHDARKTMNNQVKRDIENEVGS